MAADRPKSNRRRESRAGFIRTLGGDLMFRVYDDDECFTDYEIRHDDLSIMIDEDALAAFYRTGGVIFSTIARGCSR